MNVYDKLYIEIEELFNTMDSTYYDTELSIKDIEQRVETIYYLLLDYDEVRDENH